MTMEQRGQHVDPAGAARVPLPTPEPFTPQQQYGELLSHYNALYHTVKMALVDAAQLVKSDTPDTNVLADMAAAIIREWALTRPQASEKAIEVDKAERDEWQKRDTRWRALEMVSSRKPNATAAEWLAEARQLAGAVEGDGFTV
jgi:hypothetical protein